MQNRHAIPRTAHVARKKYIKGHLVIPMWMNVKALLPPKMEGWTPTKSCGFERLN